MLVFKILMLIALLICVLGTFLTDSCVCFNIFLSLTAIVIISFANSEQELSKVKE